MAEKDEQDTKSHWLHNVSNAADSGKPHESDSPASNGFEEESSHEIASGYKEHRFMGLPAFFGATCVYGHFRGVFSCCVSEIGPAAI